MGFLKKMCRSTLREMLTILKHSNFKDFTFKMRIKSQKQRPEFQPLEKQTIQSLQYHDDSKERPTLVHFQTMQNRVKLNQLFKKITLIDQSDPESTPERYKIVVWKRYVG